MHNYHQPLLSFAPVTVEPPVTSQLLQWLPQGQPIPVSEESSRPDSSAQAARKPQ